MPNGDGARLTTFAHGQKGYHRVNVPAMTRRLVLSTESARHPFRRALPPAALERPAKNDDNDVKLFLLSFAAFFTCFYTFIF